MSRCYPFPPPGYVKNAPVELELSSKKEKHKHKKKKKKRHNATNGDLTMEDDLQPNGAEKSGQPNEGSSKAVQRLPSAPMSHGAIQRLKIENSGNEAALNHAFVGDSEREQRFECRDDLPLSMLAMERMRADDSRTHALSNGVNSTKSVHRSQGMKSMMEGLKDGGLAAGDKRLKSESSRKLLSNGSLSASDCKRTEKSENSAFSSGVLSTKRKRLQADNSFPKSVPAADCNRTDGLQAASSKSITFMQASDSITFQPNDFQSSLNSKNGLSVNSGRSEQRSRADHVRLKMDTDGACSNISKADHARLKMATDAACSNISKAETRRERDVFNHLLVNSTEHKGDKSKCDVRSNGVLATNSGKVQGDRFKVKSPATNIMTTKCEGPNKILQPGKNLLLDDIQDSSVCPTSRLNEKFPSGSLMAGNCHSRPDQKLQVARSKFLSNSVSNVEAGSSKWEVGSHGKVTSEQKSHTINSRHNLQASIALDIQTKADKTSNTSMPAVNYKHSDSRLQMDGFRNGVICNGKLAHPEEKIQPIKMGNIPNGKPAPLEEQVQAIKLGNDANGNLVHREEKVHPIKVGHSPPSPARAATNSNGAELKSAVSTPKISLDFDDKFLKEKMMKLCIPRTQQVWVTADDEDWLTSCKQQLQSKQGEKVEDQIPQVWAKSVLLPTVGVNALPYVIPD